MLVCSHSQTTGCSAAFTWISWETFFVPTLERFSTTYRRANKKSFYSYSVIHSVKYVLKGKPQRGVSDLTPMTRLQKVSAPGQDIVTARTSLCETTDCLCCITDVCDSAERTDVCLDFQTLEVSKSCSAKFPHLSGRPNPVFNNASNCIIGVI